MEPNRSHLIEIHSKADAFNADYYCSSVLPKLSKIARQFRNETGPKLILHTDNAHPHTTKLCIKFCAKLDLRVAPHPPYSPVLAPSDCLLFGYIKDKLKGLSFQSGLRLHRAIEQTVQSINRSTLTPTFDQWIGRVERCIQLN